MAGVRAGLPSGAACAALAAVLLCGPWRAAAEEWAPQAPSCECPTEGAATDAKPGVVFRAPDPHLTLDDIAHLVAPILWFSTDEPLLVRGDTPIPRAHPWDSPSAQPVVYYQAVQIQLRGPTHVDSPVELDPGFFDKVEAVIVRFYFYYPKDIGVAGHTHDLEIAQFEIRLDRDGQCGQVRVERVVGFAHGVNWYNNRLEVTSDTRFPITLLVEEGKHASCPDRNADGRFTPGYDVNRRVSDAWGVRDVLATGYLGAAPYSPAMTKQRVPGYRVLPPPACTNCVSGRFSSIGNPAEALAVYELRPASAVSARGFVARTRDDKELVALAKSGRFGAEFVAPQSESRIAATFADPVTLARRFLPSVAYRYDRGSGVSATLPGFDLRLVYLAPKFNWVRDGQWGVEALLTNSVARIYSGYFTLGVGRELNVDRTHDWRFATEIGIRFRYRLSGWQRVIGLGYHFAGVRFGLRTSGFNDVDRLRFVFEIGAGEW